MEILSDITLTQGILLGVLALIIGLDYQLEGFFIFRPIIVAPLAGLILGDLDTGLKVGAITELAFAGITMVGGVVPPDSIVASIMGVVLAKTTGANPASALAMSIPFALLAQYINTFITTIYSFWNGYADKKAKEGNLGAISSMAFWMVLFHSLAYFVIIFLSVYVAQDGIRTLVDSMPTWLINGFDVAGGLIPAVGFAMLLKVMLRSRYFAYLLAGFVFVCYIEIGNILPVAIMGLAFALIDYYMNEDKKKGSASNGEGI